MDLIFRLAEEFLKKHKRLARYRRVFALLAAVVVFATTYELILPAITMDKKRALAEPGVEVGVASDRLGGLEASDDLFGESTVSEEALGAEFPAEADAALWDPAGEGTGDAAPGSPSSGTWTEESAANGTGGSTSGGNAFDENASGGDAFDSGSGDPTDSAATDPFGGTAAGGTSFDGQSSGGNAIEDGQQSGGDSLTDGQQSGGDTFSDGQQPGTGTDEAASATGSGEFAEGENTENTGNTEGSGTDTSGSDSAAGSSAAASGTAAGETFDADAAQTDLSGADGLEADPSAFDQIVTDPGETNGEYAGTGSADETAKTGGTDGSSAADPAAASGNDGTTNTASAGATGQTAPGSTDLAAIAATDGKRTWPATLTYEGKDYTVTATFDEKAALPEGVILQAVEILPDTEYKDEKGAPLYPDYQEYYEKTLETLEKEKRLADDQTVTTARFFDITFLRQDGLAVEPKAPVNIAVQYKDALPAAETADTMAVHFDVDEKKDETKVEVIETKTEVETVRDTKTREKKDEISQISFEADKFSVYGVIGTQVITTDFLTADGKTYTITVTYDEKAGIPAKSSLQVSELLPEEDTYTEYFDQATDVLSEQKKDDVYFSSARMFDISIMSEGKELEPKAPVKVDIAYKTPEKISETAEVNAVHLGKEKSEILNDIEVQGSEDQLQGVSFRADSFSVYAIVVIDNSEGTFEFEDQGYKVTITHTAAARFPAGTQMTIREIKAGTDEYLHLLGEAWAKINADYLLSQKKIREMAETFSETDDTPFPDPVPLKNIDGVRFFDITFMYEGEEIEPCAPVQVKIELDDGMQLYEHYGTEVVHFGSAGTEIIDGVDARLDEDDSLIGVAYSQSSFSPIGIFSTSYVENEGVYTEAQAEKSTSWADFLSAASKLNPFSLLFPVAVYGADSYTIAGKEVNGTVTFYSDEACTHQISSASSGTTVYIKATPDTGYYYSATTVTDVDANPDTKITVEKIVGQSNIYSFKMPAYNVLVTGVFQPPPEASKIMEPNGDGTYTLSLNVKGTSADLSAAANTSKKVNVIVVMDRSTSMVREQNNVNIYQEYTGSSYPVSSGPYYGLVGGEYIVLNRNNGSWTYQVSVLNEYTGTRYTTTSGNSGTQYGVVNGAVVQLTRRYGNWYYGNDRYRGTRYLESISENSNVFGFANGVMTSLSYSEGSFYYVSSTVAQTYTGKIYTNENVTRLEAEQSALDQMLDSLLSYNNPDLQGLEDVVEIEVISFATGRGDEDNNTEGYGTGSGYSDSSSPTETALSTDKDSLMQSVNNMSNASGTNWQEAMEYALDEADEIHAAQPTEDVYVLFLTDGDPTTHKGDYSATAPGTNYSNYAAELQYALTPARDLIEAEYVYPDNYDDESLRGTPTDKKNYLYGVFTYGAEGGSGQTFLKQLVNYAYGYGTAGNLKSDDAEGYLAKYFFDARDNESLLSAMDSFIAAVFSSLAYGNVNITDGVTIGGANSVTSSTLVSGKAGGFEYTVKGPNLGVLYMVTATGDSSAPTVTFHVNGREYPGYQKTTTIHITGDDPKTEDVVETEYDQSMTYWYFDETNYPNYKMCLATVDDNGLVHWDLSGIGTLQNNWTYSTSFVVWPDQDAYDYVAGLNNGIQGYEWDTEAQKDSGKGYFTNGTKYEYLVRYPGAGASSAEDLRGSTYGVLTNYEQSMSYNVLSEVTTNDETQYTYGETALVEMTPPSPMELAGTAFTVTKNWIDTLDTSHLRELIQNAEEEGNTYGVTLELYEDEDLYTSYTFEPQHDEETDVYEWPVQDINIAPALLVSELPEGTDASSFKTVTFSHNNKTYYILNEGHQYTLKETDTEYHFEFSADPYHPALLDCVMVNASFEVDEHDHIVNGSTATIVGEEPLETFMGNNSLLSELDITKRIVDQGDALTPVQENAETFTYKVSLTVPYDPEEPDKYTKYINCYEFFEKADAVHHYLAYGYQESDEETIRGLEEDVDRFSGIEFARGTISYAAAPGEQDVHSLVDMFTPDAGGKTQSGTIYVTLKQNEIIRFTNLPRGTIYTIQEIYANLRPAAPSKDANARPETNTESSNIEQQGYAVYVETKHGEPEITTTDAENDTVSGTISKADTRYYNQFINTLSDATAVNLAVRKHLHGYEWNGERYYVRLTDTSVIGRFADADRYLTRASGSEDVTYTYASPLRFAEPGEYTFTFTEYDSTWTNILSGTVSADGITYGDVVTVKVTVGKVDGKLKITNVEGGSLIDTDGDEVNDTIIATITNKAIPIHLYKIGGSDTNAALSGVQFLLYSDPDCAEEHLVTQDARGTAIGTNGILETGNDGTVRIGILKTGTYYLKETVAKDGYLKLAETVSITVTDDGMISYNQDSHLPSKMYTSWSDADELVKANGGLFITGTDKDGNPTGYTITVNNSTGAELPRTGGVGRSLYTFGGMLISITAAFMYIFRMRRRERRSF